MKLSGWFRRRGAAPPAGPETVSAMKGIFVYSPGRTGGSALVSALQHHPAIVACGQWPFEERVAATVLGQAHALALAGIAPSFSAHKHQIGVLHSQPKERSAYRDCVEQPLLQGAWKSVGNFYARVAAAQRKHAGYWVEKGDLALWHAVEDLNRHTRSVVLVRDPRDSVVSAANFFGDDNPHCAGTPSVPKVVRIATGSYGRWMVEVGERVAALRAARQPLLLLRYEDLVAQPAEHIGALLEFIDPSLAGGAPAVLAAWTTPTRAHMTARSAEASVSRWRTELPPEHRAAVEEALGPAIRALGYG
jgi:hypothetical protein